MAVIGLSGPNAIGKTTAVRRWCLRYPNLVAGLADNQREATGETFDEVMEAPPNVRPWKGTAAEKETLVNYHRKASHITVVDSARTTALNFFMPGEPIILVVTSWEIMGDMLRERCRRQGKPFRADCWTRDNLAYECRRRYLGFLNRSPTADVKVFEIEDRERDWPAVDEYFGSLFRRIHNELIRRRA